MLTEEQKAAILGKIGDGRKPNQAFAELGISFDDFRDVQVSERAEMRREIRGLVNNLRIPTTPLEEWTQGQLQAEIARMNAMKARHPSKEARADARIAEVTALLE